MAWTVTNKLKNLDLFSIGGIIICIGLFGCIYKIIDNIINFLFGINSLSGDLITYCFGLGMLVILVWMIKEVM